MTPQQRMRASNKTFQHTERKTQVLEERNISIKNIPTLLRKTTPLQNKLFKELAQILLEYLIISWDMPHEEMPRLIKHMIKRASDHFNQFLKKNALVLSQSEIENCVKLVLGNILALDKRQLLKNKIFAKKIILSRCANILNMPLHLNWKIFQDIYREQQHLIEKALNELQYRQSKINEMIEAAMHSRGRQYREKQKKVNYQFLKGEGSLSQIRDCILTSYTESKQEIEEDINYIYVELDSAFGWLTATTTLLTSLVTYELDFSLYPILFLSFAVFCINILPEMNCRRRNLYIGNLECHLQDQLLTHIGHGVDDLEQKLNPTPTSRKSRHPSTQTSATDLPILSSPIIQPPIRIPTSSSSTTSDDNDAPPKPPKRWQSSSSNTASEIKHTSSDTSIDTITWVLEGRSVSYHLNLLPNISSKEYIVELRSYVPKLKKYNNTYYIHYCAEVVKQEAESKFGNCPTIIEKLETLIDMGHIVPPKACTGFVRCKGKEKDAEVKDALFKTKPLGYAGSHRLYFFQVAKTKHNGKDVLLLGRPILRNFHKPKKK